MFPSHTPHSSKTASPPQIPAQSWTSEGNSKTVPSFKAANKPNAGSSPDKKPEAKVIALPPPKPDKGAVNEYLQSLAPEEKYELDMRFMLPMKFNRMRNQDLRGLKQEEDKRTDAINFGLGVFSG